MIDASKIQMTTCFSIVIPVLNNARSLTKVLNALENQEYPEDCYEIIVVDNGSDDGSIEVAESFDSTVCLSEHTCKNSPYSARNRGIEAASFDIVAFLDATCIPDKYWLFEAAKNFVETGADLVSGKTVFEVSQKPDIGEIYDLLFNINTCEAAKKGWAPCANLFVKKKLFAKHGKFKEGTRSGEDYRLTRFFTSSGYRLIYEERLKVSKPARNTRQVIKKQTRVARGQVGIWKMEGKFFSYLAKALFRGILPPNPATVFRAIRLRGQPWMNRKYVSIYLFRYYLLVIMSIENIKTLVFTGKIKI